MEYRKFGTAYYVRMDRGDEVVGSLLALCKNEGIASAVYSGIGGCSGAEIQTFVPETGTFETRELSGMLELVSLNGNVISGEDGTLYHHTHALFAFVENGVHHTAGGHIRSAKVLYTAEIELRPVLGGTIHRIPDAETGTGFWGFGNENREERALKQVFRSERISFVEVTELLIGDYLVMMNDYENVGRFISSKRAKYTEEQERDWVRQKLAEKAVVFSMIEKKSGEFIGNIELMDVRDSAGELGIALTAGKQNAGFGTEAVAALLRYGAEQLGVHDVCLRARPYNARAIHVYEKCGFREYHRTDEHIFMKTSL